METVTRGIAIVKTFHTLVSAFRCKVLFACCHVAAIMQQLRECQDGVCSLRGIAGLAHDTPLEAHTEATDQQA